MQTSCRNLVKTAISAGAAAAIPSIAQQKPCSTLGSNPNYAKLDAILKEPVLRREFFKAPVVIDSLELLHYEESYLCRVRSKDGAEGISISNFQHGPRLRVHAALHLCDSKLRFVSRIQRVQQFIAI